jgi:hypothetical protein
MMKDSRAKWWFTGIASTLLVVHGATRWFRVDAISIALLAIASLPFMKQYLDSLKIGDVEFNFGSLKLTNIDQTLDFLTSVIINTNVTFYKTRAGEVRLGNEFRRLVQELINKDRAKLIEKVREWLTSEDENLRWFASEIIGYFKIMELQKDLKLTYQNIMEKPDDNWPDWQLNYLWAYARFDDYKGIHELLQKTKHPETQKWLLTVYPQMMAAHPTEGQLQHFIREVNQFLQRYEGQEEVKTEEVKTKANEVLKELKSYCDESVNKS